MSLVEPLALDLNQPAIARDQALVRAGRSLLKVLEAGKAIDARIMRTAMEEAFGASDADGAWVWKDAYDAAECAQVLFLQKFGALMQRQAKTPAAYLTMIERLVGLVPSHTRRSEDAQKLQQFSTPLPLANVAAHVAGLRPSDIVLEPSAGTGMLAVFAQIAGASVVLNEYAETRAKILARLFETPCDGTPLPEGLV